MWRGYTESDDDETDDFEKTKWIRFDLRFPKSLSCIAHILQLVLAGDVNAAERHTKVCELIRVIRKFRTAQTGWMTIQGPGWIWLVVLSLIEHFWKSTEMQIASCTKSMRWRGERSFISYLFKRMWFLYPFAWRLLYVLLPKKNVLLSRSLSVLWCIPQLLYFI